MGKFFSKEKGKNKKNELSKSKSAGPLEWLDFDDEEYEDEEYGEFAETEEPENDGEYEDDEEEYDDETDEYDEEEYDDETDEYDEIDEDDEYEDDEDDEEDEDDAAYFSAEPTGFKKVVRFFADMSLVDHVVTFTGVIVLVMAVVVGSLYLGAKSDEKQIAAFVEIGIGMEEIPVIGESGLLAIADAQAAKLMAAELEEIEEEATQVDESTGKIEVSMNLTSIQKDLKIKFTNKISGKLIPNVPFTVEIKSPSKDTYTLKDDDEDGIIYQKDIASGKYTVEITGPEGLAEYSFSKEAVAVTVRDTIEYKKVEVADEIKTEAQVNVAVEDTAVNNTVVESANTDTVEWVESTKTLIEGTESTTESYEKVERTDITDPASKTAAGFRLLTEEETPLPVPVESEEPKEEETPSKTPEEEATVEPEPEETKTPVPVNTEAPVETEKPQEVPAETQKPEEVPTETKKPTASATASSEPENVPTKTASATPTVSPTASASSSATPSTTPSATPSASPSATPSAKPTATPNSAKTDTKTDLKSNSGDKLYVKDSDGNFREAKYADYYNSSIEEFYKIVTKTTGEYRYTGWQTIDGATYFFDKNGNKVTGVQVIQGAKYTFNANGVLDTGSGHLGIDVSKWNGNIDWNAVKNSGVSYAIIRCGYRGSTTGALIEDPKFRANIQGAQNAGIKVGVYFFTQAMNEVEAVEEASMVLSLIKGYNISYPVFLDVEASNGRADSISADTRTAVCKAFCQTIQNSGYKAGIYANKTWFNSYMNTPSLTGYKIWLAQYAAAPTYTRTKYDLWQYSSTGRISGIGGNVDMNISYLGY